ncbi:MAG: hypothetical protein WAV98_03040 [Minisyncoccia bacterium]
MPEEEEKDDEMIDLGDEVDFADDSIDLADDDLSSEEDAEMDFSTREIE